MELSDKGIFALALHEGVVPAPYKDSKNIWTYGIGHTAMAGDPDPSKMSKKMPSNLDDELRRVFEVFKVDVAKYSKAVSDAVKVPLKQHQFDALVSWHYNTGAVRTATLTKELNKGNYDSAAAQFMRWTKDKELIERRKQEQNLFVNGVYPTGTVPVWQTNNFGNIIWKPVRRLTMQQVLSYLSPSKSPPTEQKPTNKFLDWLRSILRG